MTRVRKDSEARVKDLAAENDALRRALATKMTRDEGEAWIEEMRAAREVCQGEIETTRKDVNRHRQRWERDVTKVNEEMKLTNDECKDRIERVVQRLEDHTSNDLHRTVGVVRPFPSSIFHCLIIEYPVRDRSVVVVQSRSCIRST